MQAPYRFLNTGKREAMWNMAIDEAILIHHIRGDVPPTLRVFNWLEPSISLGRFQSVEREIAVETCEQLAVGLVRRPTGGRAVYHRDDFTYSIVIGRREGVPAGVVAAYAYLAQGLMASLWNLGVETIISDEHVSKNPSAACFASSTQADLTSSGYKLVGSAQVWKDDSLLQQGSLPLEDHAAEFFSMLRFPDEATRQKELASYCEKTTPLHTFVKAGWDEAAAAFRAGFSAALNATFEPGELTQSELDLAQQLIEEKYSKLEWHKERVRLV